MRRGFALLFLSLAPLFAQNAAQFAGMQQDLSDLRNEVEKLKLENADLRDALTKSKAGQAPATNQAETVAKLRAEILAEVDRRLKQQGVDVNAALAEQARQVNAALAGKPAAPVATRPAPTAPTTVADKPAAWPWALFTSVVLRRRNAVAARLRAVASGYQPHPGTPPLSGRAYSAVVYTAMTSVVDLVAQLEQFMLSPAFEGAFGKFSDDSDADAGAIISVANRLMDYHDGLLIHAERCLQTPVLSEARVFVQDAGHFTLCPLLGYQKFFTTMCARVGEAQDLLPYTSRGDVVALDDATLTMTLPPGLMDQILAHIARFNE